MTIIRSPIRSQLRSPLYGPLSGPFGSVVTTLRPVANRAKQPFINTHGSDGVNTQGKYLSRHKVSPGGCYGGLKLMYTNRTREAAAFNQITVAARVRYPSGTGSWVNATFSSASNVVIASGGPDVYTDAMPFFMNAGDYVDIETYVKVASVGQKWPTLDAVSLAAANGEGSLLSTSDISGSTVTPSDTTEFYGPTAILGQSTASRAIAVMGDSIANGAVDTLTADKIGFIGRVFGDTYPLLYLASSGEKLNDFVSAKSFRMAQLAASGITDIVFNLGTNDVQGGNNQNQIRNDMLSVLAHIAAQGFYSITLVPILTKTDVTGQTPQSGYTVGGVADLINALTTSASNMPIVTKVWDARTAWQDAANKLLSATYSDDGLHPNAVGNAAIAAGAPAVSALLPAALPTRVAAASWFTSNWIYLRPADLALADGAAVTSWQDTRGLVTAAEPTNSPTFRTGMTPTGKPAIKFSSAGHSGLEKLVIPKGSQVDNIFGTFGGIYSIVRFASAGGNGTGRVWSKSLEAEALTSATNLRGTIDFTTTDIVLDGTVSANNWYVRQFYQNASNNGSLLQNTLNTATATGAGSGTHVDNSANDFIIGNHESLARGWDGDIAALAIFKGTTATADQLWAAQAYLRADTGVTLI